MKLYTKRGDDGSTGLIGGGRVSKDDLRVTAYGDVDETNAAIGVVAAQCTDGEINSILHRIQHDLFVLGTELATPSGTGARLTIDEFRVSQLERWIDAATAEVSPLKNFILPGGAAPAAALHLARTICRRAERTVVNLGRKESVGPLAIVYLNRLSDLLFALARLANHRSGVADVPWLVPKA